MEEAILMILQEAYDMFFDEDEEFENEHDIIVQNYAEDIVPYFDDKQFKSHFRINPDTFEDLLQKMHNTRINETHAGQPQLSLDKQLMITIWSLANLECLNLPRKLLKNL